MQSVHATNPGPVNTHISAAQSRADATARSAGQAAAAPSESTPTDEVRLSAKAQEIIASSEASQAAGKSAHATAYRTLAIIEAAAGSLDEQPFGRIVSQVARGVLSLADVTPTDPPASSAAPATDTGESTAAAANTDEGSAEGETPADVVAAPNAAPTPDITDALIGDLIDALTDTVEETA